MYSDVTVPGVQKWIHTQAKSLTRDEIKRCRETAIPPSEDELKSYKSGLIFYIVGSFW